MKQTILRICGWLSLIGGVFLGFRTVQVARAIELGGEGVYIAAIGQVFAGLVAWALLTTVADIADKLMPSEPEQPLYRLPPKVDEPRTTSVTTTTTRASNSNESEDERMDRVYGKVKGPSDQ